MHIFKSQLTLVKCHKVIKQFHTIFSWLYFSIKPPLFAATQVYQPIVQSAVKHIAHNLLI